VFQLLLSLEVCRALYYYARL